MQIEYLGNRKLLESLSKESSLNDIFQMFIEKSQILYTHKKEKRYAKTYNKEYWSDKACRI